MNPLAKLIRNPLLVLDSNGAILESNGAARDAFAGEQLLANDLFVVRDQVAELLERASRTGEPALGALDVRARDGTRRFRVSALALRDQQPPTYAIDFRKSEEDQFAALTKQLRELNHEVVARRHAQAQVEESLAHNRILYRELQHRVKNHLQMLLALVSAAGRDSSDPGQKLFVQTLNSKISALFDAQRLMYANANAAGVQADEILNSIANTVQMLNGSKVLVEVRADALTVSNDTAFPLALIANELLTNAVKYGCPRPNSRVAVKLSRSAELGMLEVRDEGPGFEPAAAGRASSGIGLVRGLCRQIGGRLEIRSDGGTLALVTFPMPEADNAP